MSGKTFFLYIKMRFKNPVIIQFNVTSKKDIDLLYNLLTTTQEITQLLMVSFSKSISMPTIRNTLVVINCFTPGVYVKHAIMLALCIYSFTTSNISFFKVLSIYYWFLFVFVVFFGFLNVLCSYSLVVNMIIISPTCVSVIIFCFVK